MTKATEFLIKEYTCKPMSLLTAISLINQSIPVVPKVLDVF